MITENKSRKYYGELVNETLLIAEKRLVSEQTSVWNSIVNQLHDIKEMVIEKQAFTDWEEVYERYTLGTIAAREFSDDDEMQTRLCDIFWGAVHYNELAKD